MVLFDCMLKSETEAIEGKASPLKPSVEISSRLLKDNFEVACL